MLKLDNKLTKLVKFLLLLFFILNHLFNNTIFLAFLSTLTTPMASILALKSYNNDMNGIPSSLSSSIVTSLIIKVIVSNSHSKIVLAGKVEGNECAIAGCSSHLCKEKEKASQIMTTCEFRDYYRCYREDFAVCKVVANGKCGWAVEGELKTCLIEKNTPEHILNLGLENKDGDVNSRLLSPEKDIAMEKGKLTAGYLNYLYPSFNNNFGLALIAGSILLCTLIWRNGSSKKEKKQT